MELSHIDIVFSAITALAALSGVIIAGIGLNTWKKQLRGTAEYELAKKLMLQVYQLRNELQSARSPFVSVSEGNADDTEDTWEISAYKKRWDKVLEPLALFEVTSLEAEVVWDDVLRNCHTSMIQQVRGLSFAIEMFIRQKRDSAFSEDFYRDYQDTLYRIDDNDSYSKKLLDAVAAYEKVLKPHLKR